MIILASSSHLGRLSNPRFRYFFVSTSSGISTIIPSASASRSPSGPKISGSRFSDPAAVLDHFAFQAERVSGWYRFAVAGCQLGGIHEPLLVAGHKCPRQGFIQHCGHDPAVGYAGEAVELLRDSVCTYVTFPGPLS